MHPARVSIAEETRWNAQERAVEGVEVHLYGDLVHAHQEPLETVSAAAAEELLVEEIVAGRIRLEQWDREVEQWIYRTRLVQRLFPDRSLVSYSEDDLRVIYHEIVSAPRATATFATGPVWAMCRMRLLRGAAVC